MITALNDRSRKIFRRLVEAYLESGEPVGSRTLAKRLNLSLSPATIRNVMADLEDIGLLFAPHASAGRLPTEAGMRLFVDGLLEVGNMPPEERRVMEARFAAVGSSTEAALEQATASLSGLSRCAGVVFAPKSEAPLKHIEFVALSPGRALVVMITENGLVENRIIETPAGLPPSVLVQATNYLSARLVGRTIADAYDEIMGELESHRAQLDVLTRRVVESGLATWAGGAGQTGGTLIVRGQANLLDDVQAMGDLEAIRSLFEALETKETLLRLLSLADRAEGVQIFIGSDNPLFGTSGCSMIVGPYRDGRQKVVGAIGVIGPTRMNYARIIPMVDYTAKLIGRLFA
ncbi:MAG: heat-inducible transcriptional repressor HrcA [Alphaproteobacteria bacterium]|nr:heat-inducible transcriptional repressor HrcA [Alphaproteobacteria bacterium]